MPRDHDFPHLVESLYSRRRRLPFYDQYQQLRTGFNKAFLQEITPLANANSNLLLTDHGPDHIDTVIAKASDLAKASASRLSEYECFLLLVSAVIHDIGNALGRIGHERRIDTIWSTVFGPLGFDELDKVMAIQIAGVHGGKVDGSSDTIRTIEARAEWKKEWVRPRLLAALLRLADELAEDRSRASQLGLVLEAVPRESQIFHVFSNALHTFSADPPAGELRMAFAANAKHFTTQYGKGDASTYLLTEIFERSVKAHNEARYCSRYLAGALWFDKVRVKIEIFGDRSERAMEISFLLEERSAVVPRSTIYDLAPELRTFGGIDVPLNSDWLVNHLTTNGGAGT